MPLTFSFIIPVKPNGSIFALPYLEKLSPGFDYEVIITEGTSPSRQRNLAAQKSSGDILFFIDDDSRISPASLHTCAEHFSSPTVAVVGGPSLTPPDNSSLQHLFGIALSSVFGAGAMRNRYRTSGKARVTSEKELILCNMAIRRDIFLKAGGFDERLYPNEENELLDRIQAKNLQLIHDPELAVYRSQRPSIAAFAKQMFNYGRGRGQQTCITRKASVPSFVPVFFVLYLILLPFMLLAYTFTIIPLILYMLLSFLFMTEAILRSKSIASALLFFLFPVMHISNGFGLLYGIITGAGDNQPDIENSPVLLRIIKSFEMTRQ